ncbi:MAG: ATP-grasp domain-containing protein [Pseudomonadota bacterium]|nr:ATP-grasp domain-containing protein [Pseudomonadota bacterium]
MSPADYAYGHHLPGWYDDFREVTAPTVWTASSNLEEARVALARLPAGPAIVKDYVKSAKHRWKEACFIPDVGDEDAAMAVISAFLTEQAGDLNGGVVLRALRPYPQRGIEERTGMPVIDERRVFLWRGTPLAVSGDEAALLQDSRLQAAIARLRSPFVSVDLARLEDDTWEVVEVGDGQVSGLRDMDPVQFYRALRTALDSNP